MPRPTEIRAGVHATRCWAKLHLDLKNGEFDMTDLIAKVQGVAPTLVVIETGCAESMRVT
jgi:hypothetical protein